MSNDNIPHIVTFRPVPIIIEVKLKELARDLKGQTLQHQVEFITSEMAALFAVLVSMTTSTDKARELASGLMDVAISIHNKRQAANGATSQVEANTNHSASDSNP